MVNRKVIAIIPARGGSKRIPRKNIREMNGHPLIGYTIDAALKSGAFDQVVVSTDDKEIAKIAVSYGAEVPFMREKNLADDFTPISEATLDAVKRVVSKNETDVHIAQLMANCPLRNAKDISSSYTEFIKGNARAMISVTEYGWLNPLWAVTLTNQNTMAPVFEVDKNQRSQDASTTYCPTGAIWWSTLASLEATKTFHIPDAAPFIMPWHRAIDIDNHGDWELAELLLKQKTRELEKYER